MHWSVSDTLQSTTWCVRWIITFWQSFRVSTSFSLVGTLVVIVMSLWRGPSLCCGSPIGCTLLPFLLSQGFGGLSEPYLLSMVTHSFFSLQHIVLSLQPLKNEILLLSQCNCFFPPFPQWCWIKGLWFLCCHHSYPLHPDREGFCSWSLPPVCCNRTENGVIRATVG